MLTNVLLIAALAIAVASGRAIEAVIIAVLLVLTLPLLGLFAYAWVRDRRNGRAQPR